MTFKQRHRHSLRRAKRCRSHTPIAVCRLPIASRQLPSMTSMTGNLYDEKEVMEEFISCYRHFTALWDSSSMDYLSKKKKEPGYQELLKILRRVNRDANVQDVKRKINSLRCCYRREFKKIQQAYDGYEPRLWWFHLMDFLKPVLNIQSPSRLKDQDQSPNSCDEESIHDEDIFAEPFHAEMDALGLEAESEAEPAVRLKSELKTDDSGDYEQTTPTPLAVNQKLQPAAAAAAASLLKERRRRRSSGAEAELERRGGGGLHQKKRRFVERLNRSVDGSEWHAESECDLIGKRMAAHFRNMRPDQRLFAERIISEVLVYGRMNRLTLEARFTPNAGAGAGNEGSK